MADRLRASTSRARRPPAPSPPSPAPAGEPDPATPTAGKNHGRRPWFPLPHRSSFHLRPPSPPPAATPTCATSPPPSGTSPATGKPPGCRRAFCSHSPWPAAMVPRSSTRRNHLAPAPPISPAVAWGRRGFNGKKKGRKKKGSVFGFNGRRFNGKKKKRRRREEEEEEEEERKEEEGEGLQEFLKSKPIKPIKQCWNVV